MMMVSFISDWEDHSIMMMISLLFTILAVSQIAADGKIENTRPIIGN